MDVTKLKADAWISRTDNQLQKSDKYKDYGSFASLIIEYVFKVVFAGTFSGTDTIKSSDWTYDASAGTLTFDNSTNGSVGDVATLTATGLTMNVTSITYVMTRVHAHLYDQEIVADIYLKTMATCATKATYYKSCRAGDEAYGTETL